MCRAPGIRSNTLRQFLLPTQRRDTMPSFDDIYGPRWIKAGDLDGKIVKLQIELADWQEVGSENEEKIVLAFVGQNKRLILNVTNARALAQAWSKNASLWAGRWVEMWSVETTFGPGVRVRPIEPPVDLSPTGSF